MFRNKLEISLYRYNPEEDKFPYMKKYVIDKPERDIMVLDLLNLLKEEVINSGLVNEKEYDKIMSPIKMTRPS